MSRRLEILSQQLAAERLDAERRPWQRSIAVHGFERTNHPGPGGFVIPFGENTQQVSEMLMRQGYNKTPETTSDEPIAEAKTHEAAEFFVRTAVGTGDVTFGKVYLVRPRRLGGTYLVGDSGRKITMPSGFWTKKRQEMIDKGRIRMCDKDGWVTGGIETVPASVKRVQIAIDYAVATIERCNDGTWPVSIAARIAVRAWRVRR